MCVWFMSLASLLNCYPNIGTLFDLDHPKLSGLYCAVLATPLVECVLDQQRCSVINQTPYAAVLLCLHWTLSIWQDWVGFWVYNALATCVVL